MAVEGGSDQFIDIVKLSPPAKFPAALPQDLKVAPSLKRRRSGVRIDVSYAMSAFGGALMASLFLQHTPAVTSSGALYGLLGTLLSELIWNWELQSKRVSAIVSFVFVFVCNFILGFFCLMSSTLRALEVSYQGSFLDLYFYSAEILNCQRFQSN
ncbi:hypothetical protein Ahy_A03g014271 [Arachis hypogaea]|uniref:RHOMBOID-like protein n=1 Tax=Arachis hypogaea TaxID=3818 RepID=A0A445DXM8_ARAHY|nr:hypothetical protein Ahy_A03g014271 [Arachis hypogaea]